MKVLSWTDMIRRFGDDMRFRLASLVILVTGAFFVIGAFAVAVGGGFLWLATMMPGHLAALVIAGGLFLAGVLIMAIALSRGPRQAVPAPAVAKRIWKSLRNGSCGLPSRMPPRHR